MKIMFLARSLDGDGDLVTSFPKAHGEGNELALGAAAIEGTGEKHDLHLEAARSLASGAGRDQHGVEPLPRLT